MLILLHLSIHFLLCTPGSWPQLTTLSWLPRPLAALSSANGRHHQEMEGWEEGEARICLPPLLLVSPSLGLQVPLGKPPSKPAAAPLSLQPSLSSVTTDVSPCPFDPKGGNSFLLWPAPGCFSILCWLPSTYLYLCKSSFTKWLFIPAIRANAASCQDSDWEYVKWKEKTTKLCIEKKAQCIICFIPLNSHNAVECSREEC